MSYALLAVVYVGNPQLFVLGQAGWQLASSPVQPAGAASQLFFDPVVGRVVFVANGTVPRHWEWTGSNWVQRYPNPVYSNLAPLAPAAARGLSLAQTFWPNEFTPRTFAVADGVYSEVFLTNWPSMRDDHLLVYDSARDVFILHGGNQTGGGGTMFADTWELDLGTTASFSTYGAGCMGSGGVPQISAQSGSTPAVNTQFSIQVSNLPWTGPCFMWLGFSNQSYGGLPLPVNLAILGAPQCNVLMSPDILYSIPNVLGTSVWTLGIPNVPGFTFYNQAIAFDPAANPLSLVFSNASEAIVGQ